MSNPRACGYMTSLLVPNVISFGIYPPRVFPPPSTTLILTVLMELIGMQRERSTLSQMPSGLQVLLTMVVVLGQGKDLVIPTGVGGHRKNPVVSSRQISADMVRWIVCRC